MSCISSLLLVVNGTTMQQCGSEKVPFSCPKALQAYNKYMGYVDHVNFDEKIGGSLKEKVVSRNGAQKLLWT